MHRQTINMPIDIAGITTLDKDNTTTRPMLHSVQRNGSQDMNVSKGINKYIIDSMEATAKIVVSEGMIFSVSSYCWTIGHIGRKLPL